MTQTSEPRGTRIYAHRGANREAPENSRQAFARALALGSEGLETDVQLSRDGVSLLWHDRTLEKLGLPEARVADIPWQQIADAAIARGWHGLMTLEAFIAAYCDPPDSPGVVLEIKNRMGEPQAHQERNLAQALVLADPLHHAGLIVSSFHAPSLDWARARCPTARLVRNLKADDNIAALRESISLQPFLAGACLSIGQLDRASVDLLRGEGKSIAVYTCNSAEEIDHALTLGVDILISDVPAFALARRNGQAADEARS
ncbi:MAG: glycerophosphodiester phosphodiesterase [Proteobacteria bacterium]|nr:glycerophosphodiester phosphodiesterase [Pseudomonadota bacterium]HQR02950.1 glycerophosphodiester phosphodiesterase [Rhodocyclaceae bacterium]